MGNDDGRECRGCGKQIIVIRSGGTYGRIIAEAEPVWVRQESGGDLFFTRDGKAIFGRQAGDADDDPAGVFVEAYVPHKGLCPNGGRAPRSRRRPSGYR